MQSLTMAMLVAVVVVASGVMIGFLLFVTKNLAVMR
jgi:hypothetical protein